MGLSVGTESRSGGSVREFGQQVDALVWSQQAIGPFDEVMFCCAVSSDRELRLQDEGGAILHSRITWFEIPQTYHSQGPVE